MGDLTAVAILSVLAGIGVSVIGSISSRSTEKRTSKKRAAATGALMGAYTASPKSKMAGFEAAGNELGSINTIHSKLNASSLEVIGAKR